MTRLTFREVPPHDAKSGGCAAIAEDLRTNITALAATNGGLDLAQLAVAYPFTGVKCSDRAAC